MAARSLTCSSSLLRFRPATASSVHQPSPRSRVAGATTPVSLSSTASSTTLPSASNNARFTPLTARTDAPPPPEAPTSTS